jgi:hypothetical protein
MIRVNLKQIASPMSLLQVIILRLQYAAVHQACCIALPTKPLHYELISRTCPYLLAEKKHAFTSSAE